MDYEQIYAKRLTDHDSLALLKGGHELPTESLDAVLAVASAIEPSLGDTLLSPRGGSAHVLFRGMTTSIVQLAADKKDVIHAQYETYDDAEHEVPAELLLCWLLLDRVRSSTVPLKGATPAAAEVAERRSWNVVDDVIPGLSETEHRLVAHGEAVLRHHSELRDRFVEDQDNNTYADGVDDVQRRIDFMRSKEMAPLFKKSPTRTAELVAEGEKLLADARVFRQGREGRAVSQVMLTRSRNVLFTAWKLTLDSLKLVLRPVVEDDPAALARVDATYWSSIDRMTRRVKKDEPEVETEAESAPTTP